MEWNTAHCWAAQWWVPGQGLASVSEFHHDGEVRGRGEDLQQLHDVRMTAAEPEI